MTAQSLAQQTFMPGLQIAYSSGASFIIQMTEGLHESGLYEQIHLKEMRFWHVQIEISVTLEIEHVAFIRI
jgi:hypothetical protein